MPIVSVVIPTFNGERFIGKTIESVLYQTFKGFEVLVVDDGSVDGTAQVIKGFGDRIRYIYQANGGASRARNHGIRLAEGKYIAFQDSDDLWEPEKLEVQIKYLEAHLEIGVIHCDCDGIDEEGKNLLSWKNSGRTEKLYRLFMQGQAVTMSCAVVRRYLLDKSGLFGEGFKKAGLEDIDFWSRLAEITKFHCIDQALVKHRVHRYSTCRMLETTSVPFEHRALMLEKMMTRYGNDSSKRKFLEREVVLFKSDLGKSLFSGGKSAEGRQALLESILVNLKGPRDYKILVRSLFRLIRLGLGWRRGGVGLFL